MPNAKLTVVEQRKQRDRRYQNAYGITLVEYEERDAAQGHVCKCCGRSPGTRPLSVDHSHAIARSKIVVRGGNGKWQAFIPEFLEMFGGRTRKEAFKAARRWLLRRSIRGLICWLCNTAIQRFGDNPKSLRGAANYLDSFNETAYAI